MNAPLFCALKYEAEMSRFVRSLFGCSRIARKECERWHSFCYASMAVSLEGCFCNLICLLGNLQNIFQLPIPISSGLIRVQNMLFRIVTRQKLKEQS